MKKIDFFIIKQSQSYYLLSLSFQSIVSTNRYDKSFQQIVMLQGIQRNAQNLATLQSATTVGTMLLHSCETFPSLVHHSLKNINNRYWAKKLNNKPLSNENVILCVHGRNGSHADFIPLIDNIRKLHPSGEYLYDDYDKDNFVVIDRLDYYLRTVDLGPTAHTTIDEDVKTLSDHIDRMYENCSITLVGVSKGGVVVMRYLTEMGDPTIKNVITISSPIRGTMAASLLDPESSVAKNLGYANPVVRQIEEKRKSARAKIYHVVPTWDQLIVPASSARYDDTPDSQIYHYDGRRYGHSGIAFCPEVARKVVEWAGIHTMNGPRVDAQD